MKELELAAVPLDGINLIEASAGTGKTYTIASLFIRLIIEKRLNVNEILVVTFTRAATEELNARIRHKLKDAIMALSGSGGSDPDLARIIAQIRDKKDADRRLKAALRDFDEAAIHTIHGFCHQALQDNAFESGKLFDTELVREQESLVRQITDDFLRRLIQQVSPVFARYLAGRGNFNTLFRALPRPENSGRFLEIIPPAQKIDPKRQEESYMRLYAEAQKAWPAARKDAENLLISFAGLNRNRYRLTSIPGLLQEIDTGLAGDPELLLQSESLIKFTTGYLHESTKKGFTFPGLLIFDMFEKLYAERDKLLASYEKYLLNLKIEAAAYLQRELAIRKGNLKIQYYDDLLTNLHDALLADTAPQLIESIRKRFKAALIDEFQDTDPLQYEIFRTLFGHRGGLLFLIGDPKQAIYSFRGADIFAYMEAARQAQVRYTLRHNWRAEPNLIEAINELFSRTENPFVFDDIRFLPATPGDRGPERLTIDGNSEPQLQIWFIDGGGLQSSAIGKSGVINKEPARKLITNAVAGEIAGLLRRGQNRAAMIDDKAVAAGDLAVLVRTNLDALTIKQALDKRGIPAVLFSIENVFESREAQELQLILEAISRPANEPALKASLTTDIMGMTGEEIYALASNETAWAGWLTRFHDYNQTWNRHAFIRMFERFLIDEKVRPRLMGLPDGERRLTNLLHLAELLHHQDKQQPAGMTGLLKWLARNRQNPGRRLEEYQLRLESDENAVKIVTIHKSKGLQYPIVFCPFAWSDSKLKENKRILFHDEASANRLTLDLGSPERDKNRARAEIELLAENMRLLYVAVTRAKNRCYLVWGKFNQAETSAPAYLFHSRPGGDRRNIITDTEAAFKNLTDQDILNRLKEYETRAAGKIEIADMPQISGDSYRRPASTSLDLSCRKFTGLIETDWKITSFSQLTSTRYYLAELPDRDYSTAIVDPALPVVATISPDQKPAGIFGLPKGVKTGNLIHDIFENIDFADCGSPESIELINRKLGEHGFDLSYQPAIAEMVNKVVTIPLSIDDNRFKLAQVDRDHRLSELEFYFPLNKIDREKLKVIIARHGLAPAFNMDREYLERLRFSPVRGFMKGFIDLIFQFGDKFYIVDWKSNHLGDRPEAYSREKIAAVMQNSFYTLQYILYTVALDRYLQARIPGYSYDRNFGGVFYMFIKGIDPAVSPENGIFGDKPAADFIRKLSKYLIAEPGKAND